MGTSAGRRTGKAGRENNDQRSCQGAIRNAPLPRSPHMEINLAMFNITPYRVKFSVMIRSPRCELTGFRDRVKGQAGPRTMHTFSIPDSKGQRREWVGSYGNFAMKGIHLYIQGLSTIQEELYKVCESDGGCRGINHG